jgi:hypothetical protein
MNDDSHDWRGPKRRPGHPQWLVKVGVHRRGTAFVLGRDQEPGPIRCS